METIMVIGNWLVILGVTVVLDVCLAGIVVIQTWSEINFDMKKLILMGSLVSVPLWYEVYNTWPF